MNIMDGPAVCGSAAPGHQGERLCRSLLPLVIARGVSRVQKSAIRHSPGAFQQPQTRAARKFSRPLGQVAPAAATAAVPSFRPSPGPSIRSPILGASDPCAALRHGAQAIRGGLRTTQRVPTGSIQGQGLAGSILGGAEMHGGIRVALLGRAEVGITPHAVEPGPLS